MIASVSIFTTTSNENQFKSRDAYARDVGTVVIQSGGGEIGNWATLAWDFHAGTVTINNATYSFPTKWRDGITFQYNINPCWYMTSDEGDAQGATMSCTYSITA
jgi:hypothetical protein